MTKSYFRKVAALWMFSWELSTISVGSSTFLKLYFKVYTLNRALHSYFVSLLHWFFLVFRGTGGLLQYSSIQGNAKAIQDWSSTLFFPQRIMLLTFVLKNCEILEKIRTKNCETVSKEEATVRWWETLWNWVTHSKTVRVKTSQFTLFTYGKKFFFKVQLDFIRFLESSLYFLYQHS